MIFTKPASLPDLPSPLPLQEPIGDFALAASFAKTEDLVAKTEGLNLSEKRATIVDNATGTAWTTAEISDRVERVATALCSAWGIVPGQKWHKIVALLTSNSVDVLTLSWAVHRLGGACLMLQPTSSADEIAEHLGRTPPCAMFVSDDLLALGEGAVQKSSVASEMSLYRLTVLNEKAPKPKKGEPEQKPSTITTLEDLVVAAKDAPSMPKTPLSAEEASTRVAYYCTTSGTGGVQKIVAITHENMIACVLQASTFYTTTRAKGHEVNLGFLPFNHIYGLLITHTLLHLGDSIIIHRGFNMLEILMSIDKHKINSLFLVPPIINAISRNAAILGKFDLSSVSSITSGGGPLNKEDFTKIQAVRPNWRILSGWGQTEGCGIGSLSPPDDIFPGSSGVLLPDVRIRLKDDQGREVEELETQGEIEISSPSIIRGYVEHADDALLPTKSDKEFWWVTGDVGLFRKSPKGEPHLFLVDRIRDMIKVKGIQVAPGQIEAHLGKHAAIAEVAVVGVPDQVAGERPLAFVVREPTKKDAVEVSEDDLRKTIREYNDSALPEVCRLQDRIRFVEQIPKSASGKILKRELRKLIAA